MHNSIPYLQRQQIQQEQIGNTTVQDTGSILLMGVKHALPRKHATKCSPTARKHLRTLKRGVNDSLGR